MPDPRLPPSIGRYEVVRRVGRGGMGVVYLARDPTIDRLVAIKLLSGDLESDELWQRFLREARSTGRLTHPNIVTLFDAGEHDEHPFIAMEYVDGQTLAEIVKAKTPLPLSRKLSVLADVCSGLHYAHQAGIIHRDVKPANIMIAADGTTKILDFGIARIGASNLTVTGAIIGTPNYMSPEQLDGLPVDERADIFSFGSVAYELLSYQRAFSVDPYARAMRHVNETPVPIETLVPGLDADVVTVVNGCLERDPRKRWSDLDTVRRRLLSARARLKKMDAAAAKAAEASDVSAAIPPPTPPRRTRDSDRAGILQKRAAKVEEYLSRARQALTAGEYASALDVAREALVLEPDHAEAGELEERAIAALEQQEIDTHVAEANDALDRGDLSAAQHAVDRALAIDARSGAAVALGDEIEAARQKIAAERQATVHRARSDVSQPPAPPARSATPPFEPSVNLGPPTVLSPAPFAEAARQRDNIADSIIRRPRDEESGEIADASPTFLRKPAGKASALAFAVLATIGIAMYLLWPNPLVAATAKFKAGNAAFQQQDYPRAASLYEEAIAKNPSLGAAYFYLGNSYDKQFDAGKKGDPQNDQLLQKAVINYQHSIDALAGATDPVEHDLAIRSLQYLAAAYATDKMNEPAKEESTLQRLIQLDPGTSEHYFVLAKVYEDAGSFAAAERTLINATTAKPKDSMVYRMLAGYYTRHGQFEKTMDALKQYAKVDPTDAETFETIAAFYWDRAFRNGASLTETEKSDYVRRGLDAIDRALQLKPDYVDALTYKNLLLRVQATLEKNPGKQRALIAEATQLSEKAKKLQAGRAPTPPSSAPPSSMDSRSVSPAASERFDVLSAEPTLMILSGNGRRSLPISAVDSHEMVALEDLANALDLKLAEDNGALVVKRNGNLVVLTPPQPFVSANGRIVSLPIAPERSGTQWLVPLEIVNRALTVIYDGRLDLPPGSHLLVVGADRNATDTIEQMPDLIGLNGERGKALLAQYGFRVSAQSVGDYPGVPSGIVIRQTPVHGAHISRADSITLETNR